MHKLMQKIADLCRERHKVAIIVVRSIAFATYFLEEITFSEWRFYEQEGKKQNNCVNCFCDVYGYGVSYGFITCKSG